MLNLKSKLTIKVFGYYFINPQARSYIRELARLLKVDPGNLSKKMSELKKDGFFITENEGKNVYFKLNKDLPFLTEYKNIYEAKYGVTQSLTTVLKEVPGLKEAYIFGSYAKGNFENDSDIDLLIVGSHDYSEIIHRLVPLEKNWHREINLVDLSLSEFVKKTKNHDPLLANIFSGKTIKII